MNRKGFTLIELLAVIVILAVIAVISTPIIVGIIEDANINSRKRSIDSYGKAIEQSIVAGELSNITAKSGTYTSSIDGKILTDTNSNAIEVKYSGENVKCNIVRLNYDGTLYLSECSVKNILVENYTYGKIVRSEEDQKLNRIEASLTKTEFKQNEELSTLTVIAYDNDGTSYDVTKSSTTNYDSATIGEKTLTVTYNSKTTTLSYEIIEKPDFITEMVPNEGNKITYTNGQLINLGTYGIRYQGSNPNNYVTFNNEDWRIIGVVDGKVKLIRVASISMPWDCKDKNDDGDCSDSEESTNNWETSTLQAYLNGEYYQSLEAANPGMIADTTYYLKGWNSSAITKDVMYDKERNGSKYNSSYPDSMVTKIGLMYASDYGYAAMETDTCLSTTTLSDYSDCAKTDWLKSSQGEWTIIHYSNQITYVVNKDSTNVLRTRKVYSSFHVRPVLSLNSNVKIIGGSGIDGDEYKLGIVE